MSQDYYERFSESNKIRLLCEKDQEIYNLEKELEELKEQNKSLLALKLELEKLKNINSLKRDKIVFEHGVIYKSDTLDVLHYCTEDDVQEYYELEHPNIANELFKNSDFHLIENSRVRVYIEVF